MDRYAGFTATNRPLRSVRAIPSAELSKTARHRSSLLRSSSSARARSLFSWRSWEYRRAFSSEIAACEASSFSTAIRAGGKDEKTPRGSRVLDGHGQQPVDQPVEDDLAGHRLRGLEDGGEVQLLDRSGRRRGLARARRPVAQERMRLFELPHLPAGAPAQIAVPGVAEIGVSDRLEAARSVEARSELVRERLVLDETVLPRQPDGVFIQALRVQMPVLGPRELGPDEREAVSIVVGTVVGPELELLQLLREEAGKLLPLRAGCFRLECDQRQRVDEVVCGLDGHGHGGGEHRLRPLRPLEGLGMAPVKEGQDLLHDVVEDDAAAERRLCDGVDASCLVEAAVGKVKRIRRSSLETRDELLLETDGLVDRVVVALLRE